MLSPRLIPPAQAALAAIAAATPAPAVGPEPGTTEAAIVPLFPQKERDLKKGLPSGMTAGSFWASRGITKPTMLPDGKVLTDDFEGPIPYGVHTLWNVVEAESDDRSPPRSARSFADERPPDGVEQRLAQSVRTLPSPARVTPLLRRFGGWSQRRS